MTGPRLILFCLSHILPSQVSVAAPVPPPASAPVERQAPRLGPLTLSQAMAIAVERNLSLIAARLDVDVAEVERMAAGMLDNPDLSYTMANIVLGAGYDQEQNIHPSTFEQRIQNIEISQTLDVWFKRRARVAVAEKSIEASRERVQDALREVQKAVASAFAAVVREQDESALASQARAYYDETVSLFQKRFDAGDISEAELSKTQLEQLKSRNNELDATAQLLTARLQLAALLAWPNIDTFSATLLADAPPRTVFPQVPLLQKALQSRPDMRGLLRDKERAALDIDKERRERLSDITASLGYSRSLFQISGDNPHTLGFGLSLPLPVFDRNQAGIAQATLEAKRVDNEIAALRVSIAEDIGAAHAALTASLAQLQVFETAMLQKAERALRAAEKSFQAGAFSLLELLEAQRTHLETRADYLRTLYEWRQSRIDLEYAVGSDLS